MLCVRRWSDAGAGGQGQVLASTVPCQEPKTGSKMLNSITKTIHFAHLGILIFYLCD